MEIARYFAMTAQEFAHNQDYPGRKAWMACHFAHNSTSLSNLPATLPEGSLLILDDSTPPSNQDPQNVRQTLGNIIKSNKCSGLLLDFQRPGNPKCAEIVSALLALDCPVCVSQYYAENLNCPIFLPPLPLTIELEEYILPYRNREIWLDISLSCEKCIITEAGCISQPYDGEACPLADRGLCCHYGIDQSDKSATFALKRTKEDLEDLLLKARNLGITTAVGLYQELK